MKRLRFSVAAACLAVFAIAVPPAIAESPAPGTSANLSLALAIDDAPVLQCRAGKGDDGQCSAIGERVAAGAECPAASGSYCSDEFPYCCGTPGNYYCAKDVNSC